jgi:hypothetical protein
VEFSFDSSCAVAIYMTSPVMTAITAPLTIPISFVWDNWLYGEDIKVGLGDYFASLLILFGVVLVELKPSWGSLCIGSRGEETELLNKTIPLEKTYSMEPVVYDDESAEEVIELL